MEEGSEAVCVFISDAPTRGSSALDAAAAIMLPNLADASVTSEGFLEWAHPAKTPIDKASTALETSWLDIVLTFHLTRVPARGRDLGGDEGTRSVIHDPWLCTRSALTALFPVAHVRLASDRAIFVTQRPERVYSPSTFLHSLSKPERSCLNGNSAQGAYLAILSPWPPSVTAVQRKTGDLVMLAQRCLAVLLGGVLITVVSMPATAAEALKTEVATATGASLNGAKANPTLMNPETARIGSALATSHQPPSCSSDRGVENSRRCLRLTEPPPAPTPTAPPKPSAGTYAPAAPSAAPARSWLGAVGKRIVGEMVQIAEAPYSDGGDWRATMTAEIQAKLGQARLTEASSKQLGGQPSSTHLASGS